MSSNYGICNLAIAPMRADHSDRAEIVSHLLFGDAVQVLEAHDCWRLVVSASDGYQGWVDFKQITIVSEAEYIEAKESRFVAPLQFVNSIQDASQTTYYLQAGSTLPALKGNTCSVGENTFNIDFTPLDITANEASLIDTAHFFLNAPYLWGGRSQFGIDCSGFTQLVFKMHGIPLKRDASMQVESGALVAFLSEAKAGDLAFFDNSEGKITHVGILLNNQEIIHASGKVRIDPIDDQGIFNKDLNKYTHTLRVIKRFF